MEENKTQEESSKELIEQQKKLVKPLLKPFLVALAIIAVIGVISFSVFWGVNPEQQEEITKTVFTPIIENQTEAGTQDGIELIPEPLRQKYYRENWGTKRENFIEQGAKYLRITEQELLSLLKLSSNKEIWSELPSVPEDFGEINYLMQNGKFFALEALGEEYWKQPEFYPMWKNCPKYWTEPDPRYWNPNGYGAYVSKQYTAITKGEEFYAIVYVHSGCGVQTWQGTRLEVSNNARDYFNVSITPNEFLLEPVFPKISYGWVQKIEVKGSIKEGTPEGAYEIIIDVVPPNKEKQNEWSSEYKALYFNASQGVRPAKALISLEVTVQ